MFIPSLQGQEERPRRYEAFEHIQPFPSTEHALVFPLQKDFARI